VLLSLVFVLPYALIMAEVGSTFTQEGGPYEWTRLAFGRFHGALAAVLYWVTNPLWVGGSLALIATEAWDGNISHIASGSFFDYLFKTLFIWFSIGVANRGAAARQMDPERRRDPARVRDWLLHADRNPLRDRPRRTRLPGQGTHTDWARLPSRCAARYRPRMPSRREGCDTGIRRGRAFANRSRQDRPVAGARVTGYRKRCIRHWMQSRLARGARRRCNSA
jgi:hypothetical protein